VTLVVGAPLEASAALGVGGDASQQADNSLAGAGAVYVFQRNSSSWIQQAYIKPASATSYGYFGDELALSSDGSTLAVGSYTENGSSKLGGSLSANGMTGDAGAVYLYRKVNAVWSQAAYLKSPNTAASQYFGIGVAMSGDGSVLGVAATGEAGGAAGVNGNIGDQSKSSSGAVFVYR